MARGGLVYGLQQFVGGGECARGKVILRGERGCGLLVSRGSGARWALHAV